MGDPKYYSERNGGGPPKPLARDEARAYFFETLWAAWSAAEKEIGKRELALAMRIELGIVNAKWGFKPFTGQLGDATYFSFVEFVFRKSNESHKNLLRYEFDRIFPHYKEGQRFDAEGNVVSIAKAGIGELLERRLADVTEDDRQKVTKAILLFRHVTSTRDDKKDAVRIVGDILESLKEKGLAKTVPDEEASQIFHFVNKFKIRHHKSDQNDDYDDAYLDWMFVRALATLHLFWDLKAKEVE